jgi:hypothetical protein
VNLAVVGSRESGRLSPTHRLRFGFSSLDDRVQLAYEPDRGRHDGCLPARSVRISGKDVRLGCSVTCEVVFSPELPSLEQRSGSEWVIGGVPHPILEQAEPSGWLGNPPAHAFVSDFLRASFI